MAKEWNGEGKPQRFLPPSYIRPLRKKRQPTAGVHWDWRRVALGRAARITVRDPMHHFQRLVRKKEIMDNVRHACEKHSFPMFTITGTNHAHILGDYRCPTRFGGLGLVAR